MNHPTLIFYEFPKRPEILKDIGQEQVHSLEQLENLWLSYFDEIVAGSEIKSFKANITNPNGENLTGNVTRYGLFSASHDGEFLKPVSSLNSFQLLAKQPESMYTKTLRKHNNETIKKHPQTGSKRPHTTFPTSYICRREIPDQLHCLAKHKCDASVT